MGTATHAPRTLVLLVMAQTSCEGLLGGGPVGTSFVKAPPACGAVALPTASPQLWRLPHVHYDNVLSDLFGMSVGEAGEFAPDPVVAGFDNDAKALRIDARLFADYQRVAEALALEVVSRPSSHALVVPCTPTGDGAACARAFITSFGRRAFRRPLDEAEVARYAALFAGAATLYTEGTSFDRGVRLVLEAMMQSPHFLFRAELEEETEVVGKTELVRLSGFTIASRLAALLWASNPDDQLLDAAAAGLLDAPEGIRQQAARMIASPKVQRVVDDFHAQWLQTREFGVDPKVPALPETVGESMRAEVREFVRDIAAADGTYADLMTSPHTYADASLAPLYGLRGSWGTTPLRAELDPLERAGLMTQLGLLSAHAGSTSSSPIHRGVFVMRQFLCTDIEPPSFQIDPTLPPLSGDIVTTRDQVEHHTANPTCQSCHELINGIGFSLENYDARGSYRTLDNGAPVDASGRFTVHGYTFAFDDGVGLAHQLVDSGIGPRCYVQKWLAYSFGRAPTHEDACAATTVADAIAPGGHKLKDVLTGLTDTLTFRYRALEN
jgi:hypothetical protein